MMPTILVDVYSVSVSPDTRLGWLGSSTKLSYLPTDFYNENFQFMRFVKSQYGDVAKSIQK